LAGVGASADPELRPSAVELALQADRGDPVLVRPRNRLALAQRAIEADREDPGHVIVERFARSHDTVDVGQQRVGQTFVVANR
jgi:hypothetical protein